MRIPHCILRHLYSHSYLEIIHETDANFIGNNFKFRNNFTANNSLIQLLVIILRVISVLQTTKDKFFDPELFRNSVRTCKLI